MPAEPFMPEEPEEAGKVRLAFALGLLGLGHLLIAGILIYLVPPAAQAQWANPPTKGIVVKEVKSRSSKSDRTYYVVRWDAPGGGKSEGSISPLIDNLHVGQQVGVRFADRPGRNPQLFLDDWLELWGPPVGVLLVGLLVLGPETVRIIRRLRARPRCAPTRDSGRSP